MGGSVQITIEQGMLNMLIMEGTVSHALFIFLGKQT